MSDRKEIERIKRDMRHADRLVELKGIIQAWRGSDEDRAIARAEIDAEADVATASVPLTPERNDPRQMTTREEVEAARRGLEKDGKPSGERSIAAALGISRDAVRYALGKDRN